jgi:hypothetical protein
MADGFLIGPDLLGKIRRVTDTVDGMPASTGVTRIPTRLQDIRQQPTPALRFVSWTQTWSATSTATVAFKGGTQTATAVNAFAGVGPGDGWVARHSGTWYLAVVNLTMQPSYTSGDIQLLGHDDEGILNWYSVTQCGSTAA